MSNRDDKFPEQVATPLIDLNNITIGELRPGILNQVGDGMGSVPVSAWDSNDVLTSSIDVIKGMVDDSERITTTKFVGVIAGNPTPRDDNQRLTNEIQEISKDAEYKLGYPRAYCYVYIPEIHLYNRPVDTFEPSQLSQMDEATIRLLPKVWGPRSFVKDIKVGSFMEVEFTIPKDFTYAKFTTVNRSDITIKQTYDFKKENARNPKKKAMDPKTKKQRASEARAPINSPDLKASEKELLDLPPPKERPSPKSRNLYHTSVDKSLLIGPSPRGHIDWTGCGGRGTLSMSGGKPKSGPKRYYLKGNESDSNGKLIVDLPTDLCYGRRLQGHRAIIEPLRAMLEQARADGMPSPLFKVYSCWRSVDQQHEGFKYWFYKKYGGNKNYPIYSKQNREAYRKCRKYNGDPFDPRLKGNIGGDHMAGRGIDIFLGVQQNTWCGRYQRENPGTTRSRSIELFKRFMESKASYQWLKINAEFFGFYNYPAEPWHWCYNPDDRAERSDKPLELEGSQDGVA